MKDIYSAIVPVKKGGKVVYIVEVKNFDLTINESQEAQSEKEAKRILRELQEIATLA